MRKLLVGVIIFFIGFACCLILTHGLLRAQGEEMLNKGEEASNNSEVMAKLDDIAKSQQEITSVINSIKEDIAIIKIRITQMQ